MVPDSVRANLWDCLLEWNHCRWTVEGEYTGKHYVHDSYKTIHAYSILANYRLPLHKSVFNQLSFQGRWDGLTDHSNGIRNAAGWLYGNDKARNRITVGTTLSYIKSPIRADIRLNYEKMFYHDGYEPGDGNRDKLLMEFVVRF
jgi:hypothetical protein